MEVIKYVIQTDAEKIDNMIYCLRKFKKQFEKPLLSRYLEYVFLETDDGVNKIQIKLRWDKYGEYYKSKKVSKVS